PLLLALAHIPRLDREGIKRAMLLRRRMDAIAESAQHIGHLRFRAADQRHHLRHGAEPAWGQRPLSPLARRLRPGVRRRRLGGDRFAGLALADRILRRCHASVALATVASASVALATVALATVALATVALATVALATVALATVA